MRSHGADFISLNDPTFNVDDHHCRTVCSVMAELDFEWTCMIRADPLQKELVRMMYDSGCKTVFLGIEAASQHILDAHNKGITVSQIHRAIEICLSEGLQIIGFLMLGLPGETKASLEDVISFIHKYPIIPRARYATPYPGTTFYDLWKSKHPEASEEVLLHKLSEVTNGPDDNLIFDLSDINHDELNYYMQIIRDVGTERAHNLSRKVNANLTR